MLPIFVCINLLWIEGWGFSWDGSSVGIGCRRFGHFCLAADAYRVVVSSSIQGIMDNYPESDMDTSVNPFDDILMDTCDGFQRCENPTRRCLLWQEIQGWCKYCWVLQAYKGQVYRWTRV